MSYNLKGKSGLIVTDLVSNQKMLVNILKVLGVKDPQVASDVITGFRVFREGNFDFVLSEIKDGRNDVVALAELIRKDERSPNPFVPIISTVGSATKVYVDDARNAGVTEVIMAPYTVSDVGKMISFAIIESGKRQEINCKTYKGPDRRRRQDPNYMGPFRREGDDLLRESVERIKMMQEQASQKEEQAAPDQESSTVVQPPQEQDWPGEEESHELTKSLLDSYLKHHEIVFSKLKFAQEATQKGIEQIRKTYEDVKDHNATNILEFKNFDQMWEEIIEMFVAGGLTEEEVFKIEDVITGIPPDIKEHYDSLTAQDKTFLTLVESLNVSAYKKAKQKVSELQSRPNVMSGMSGDEYQEVIDEENRRKEMEVKPDDEDKHNISGVERPQEQTVAAKSSGVSMPEKKTVFKYDSDGNLIQ